MQPLNTSTSTATLSLIPVEQVNRQKMCLLPRGFHEMYALTGLTWPPLGLAGRHFGAGSRQLLRISNSIKLIGFSMRFQLNVLIPTNLTTISALWFLSVTVPSCRHTGQPSTVACSPLS